MEGRKILLIDDDPDLVSLLEHAFSREGAQVYAARDGREGWCQFYTLQPDLVILDAAMPVMDGWQTLSRIRELSDVPVIVLTASEVEAQRGLKVGGVDRVVKPFSIPDLVVRARAVLGASRPHQEKREAPPYDDGHLRVDLEARQVRLDGDLVPLTETEYGVLAYLVEYADRVLTLEQILHRVWGPAYMDAPQYVRAYVRRLRLKLEVNPADPEYLLTLRGIGYRFRPQARASNQRG